MRPVYVNKRRDANERLWARVVSALPGTGMLSAQRALAKAFGVHQRTVWSIVNNMHRRSAA